MSDALAPTPESPSETSLALARRVLSTIPPFLTPPDPAGVDLGHSLIGPKASVTPPAPSEPPLAPFSTSDAARFEILLGQDKFLAPLRQLGVEGDSLFGRARLRPHQLLTLLHDDLTRLFRRADLSPASPGWVRERHHGAEWRSDLTEMPAGDDWRFDRDAMRERGLYRREADRMRDLGRRFRARLAGGGLILVLAGAEPVEPALLAMIQAELTRLGGGAPFWLLVLGETDQAAYFARLETLSERVLAASLPRSGSKGEALSALLRQALEAAPFAEWEAVQGAVAAHLGPGPRALPFPSKTEVGSTGGEHDFGWGEAVLLHGHDWSRQVDSQFLLHASEPSKPETALEWRNVRLLGATRLRAEAEIPIATVAPLRLELTAFQGEAEIARTACEMSDGSRAATLSLAFPARARDGLRVRLRATTLNELQTGERSVVALRAVQLEPAEPDAEPPEAAEAAFVPVVAPRPGDESLFSREIMAPRETWAKTLPRFLLNLSGEEPDVSRIYKVERLTQGRAVDRFENAGIVGFNGIVRSGRFFDRYTVHGEDDLLRMARAHGTYENAATGLQLHEGGAVLAREALERAEHLEGSIFLGTPDEPDNWGMWLLLGLPGMHHFASHRDRYDRFLCERQHPWQRSLLQTFGLADEDIVEQRRGATYWCESVSLLRMVGRDLILAPHERDIFRDLAERLAHGSAAPAPERVFLSRLSRTRKGGAYRGLLNEEELIDALVPLGFTVVEPEHLSFAEQVALFAKARVVVGLGGAAMFNTVFCQPETQVVTIESTGVFLDAHTNLFSSLGLAYGVVIGEEDRTDPRPSQRRWRLDVPGTVAALREMLA
ncbi:DUF563 domain-containing protein [Aureimonas sp. AU20]|uniref:glycosyltransferase family 61 protein n=1 Tax=Aureimonas sp. AU20 TaxID=1349819 RepID=UPI0007230ABA|nr:glycosyltransferase family 61 protein [Aureimonas sp. AU20]ALN74592.1 hypothetical protein M673_17892 [Aureimonas sp. AU20]